MYWRMKMLDKLRIKLTILCVLITAGIITVITIIAFSFSARELNKRSHFALMNQLTTVEQHLQGESSISHTWLAQQEADNHSIISISTKNGAFIFPGAYHTVTDRNILVDKAREIGISEYSFNAFSRYSVSDENNSVIFSLHTSSEHFLAAITAMTYNDHQYELIILKDMAQDDAEISYLRLIFIGLILCGILLLGLFSWWFAGKAIKPIKISHQEQIDFVAAASHELRSPVAVIQAVTEEMLENKNAPDKQGLYTIHHECSHLSRLIGDLLLLARVDSGKWSVNKQPVEVDTLVLEVYDRFLPLVEAHHQKLNVLLPDSVLEPLLLDKQRIEQVLSILIDNAMSYTPAGTQITLTLDISEDSLEIGVIDNGPGIPDEAKANVFRRFYRLDTSRKSDTHYGLGLSIAYEILKLHGGRLTLNDSHGGGCNFKLIITPVKP